MVNDELWHEIHNPFKLKESKKSIARALGLSVQTVCKVLRQENLRQEKQRPLSGLGRGRIAGSI